LARVAELYARDFGVGKPTAAGTPV
jgi:hypothetical protein